MADLPARPSRRISREALERIIQRAAELQASELDTGESITEQELLKLGADVGIDGRFLRQAIYEEAAGPQARERGFVARWIGPAAVSAGRVVPGDRAAVERALEQWMTESEALTPKRRLLDRTVWERQKGFFAEMRRGFGAGGKSYQLAKAEDVTVVVTQLEPGYCHVELGASIRDRRNGVATGASVVTVSLGAVGIGVMSLPFAAVFPVMLVALAPFAAAVATPMIAARSHQRFAAETQLALEQLLDRLELGEIKPRHQSGDRVIGGVLGIVEEIRRAIGDSGRVDEQRRLK